MQKWWQSEWLKEQEGRRQRRVCLRTWKKEKACIKHIAQRYKVSRRGKFTQDGDFAFIPVNKVVLRCFKKENQNIGSSLVIKQILIA